MRLRTRIENLIRPSQELRDSDKKLLLALWEQEGLYLSESQKATFMRCSTAESITRARRSLQGKYPASRVIQQSRLEQRAKMREVYSPARAISWLNEED